MANPRPNVRRAVVPAVVLAALALAGCGAGASPASPSPVPSNAAAPTSLAVPTNLADWKAREGFGGGSGTNQVLLNVQ
jgi:hypothetical protein